MQQFQISLLRLFINKRLIHINNAAFDKTVAKLFIILKVFKSETYKVPK